MANVLDASRMAGFYNLARELGMEVLFEVHTGEEIALLPPGARVVGINSRKFKSTTGFVGAAGSSSKDFTLTFDAFDLVEHLPKDALHIAESGICPENLTLARDRFDAVLVGTSLLRDPAGIRACLAQFENSLNPENAI
jgi:indole-3-glycerol phosphate synthase